jgi:H+-transporting ATPase
VGTALTLIGLSDFTPLPWWQIIALFAYAMISCLGVNDALKVALIKWRIPASVGLNEK